MALVNSAKPVVKIGAAPNEMPTPEPITTFQPGLINWRAMLASSEASDERGPQHRTADTVDAPGDHNRRTAARCPVAAERHDGPPQILITYFYAFIILRLERCQGASDVSVASRPADAP